MKAIEFVNGLPGWAKGALAVGGLLISYTVSRAAIKAIEKRADSKSYRDSVANTKSDLGKLKKDGMKPSYGASQYTGWANMIKRQYDGCDMSLINNPYTGGLVGVIASMNGSNSFKLTAGIFNQLKNDVDFLELVAACGVLEYDQCGIWIPDFEGDLYSAIADELDTAERKELNTLLKKRNITYTV